MLGLAKPRSEAWATVSRDPSNATHEYIHHLQAAMPEVDRLSQALHLRRTTLPNGDREPVVTLNPYDSTGRRDQYIDDYFGREYDPAMLAGIGYDPDRPATEVMTRAFQILFHRLPGKEPVDLDDLVRDDPEMLDLALGLLFHYDPA